MDLQRRGARRLFAAVILVILTLSLAGCDSIFGPNRRRLADDARIIIQGTSPVPLLLVTSTSFTAVRDQNGELVSTLVQADTVTLTTLPAQFDHDLRGRDRFLVRLINPDLNETAAIHMQVLLDGRISFNQQATMRDASLEYIVVYE